MLQRWFVRGWLVWATLASGCAEPRLAPQALPELSATRPGAIVVHELRLAPGERMSWDVRLRGLSVGTAELTVSGAGVASPSDLVVTSRFRTSQLASSVLFIEHHLRTVVRGAAPRSSVDDLQRGHQRRRTEARFDAGIYRVDSVAHRPPDRSPVHTVHSALGWLRLWADPLAPPGHIHLLHGQSLYRIELLAPLRETAPGSSEPALRIDCRALPADASDDGILLTIWLSDDERRVPLRLDAVVDDMRVLAVLIEHSR